LIIDEIIVANFHPFGKLTTNIWKDLLNQSLKDIGFMPR